MTKRLTMTEDEALHVLGYCNKTGRYKFSDKTKWQEALEKRKRYRNKEDDVISNMSAMRKDGHVMDIDEYCSYYNIDRESVRSFKLITHTGNPFYNIQSNNIEDVEDNFLDIKQLIEDDLKNIKYEPKLKRDTNRPIVVSIADLHFGAYVDNLVKTKDFSINILANLLIEASEIINSYNSKEVHVHILGDLIESFSGLNHKNSWKGLQKGMIGAEVIKLTTKVIHDNLLSRINNLHKVRIIAGNHDRVTSAKDEDTDGDAANIIAWGLELVGYDVEFNPFILSNVVDGINYIDLHGDQIISKRSTKDICWDYGKQGVFNFIREGHLHSTIERLSVSQRKVFNTIKDDSIDHRRMNIPSFFTGNSYSERLGFTSNSGFVISYNNGKGVPNVDFKAL